MIAPLGRSSHLEWPRRAAGRAAFASRMDECHRLMESQSA